MNKHTKILAAILSCLLIAYYLFGLNGFTVIFWAIALCVGYGLLLASMRIWQKRKIRKYHKKHKTIPKTYEDLEKHLKSSISAMPNLKKKLTLPNVTLLAVTSVEIEEHQMSLKISSQNIEFGAVKLLSSSLPEKKYSDIEKFPVVSTAIPQPDTFIASVNDPNFSVYQNAGSVEDYIKSAKEDGLTHLVTDGKNALPKILNDVFYNEKNYRYIVKQFDSKEAGFKYHINVYKIDYEIFDTMSERN